MKKKYHKKAYRLNEDHHWTSLPEHKVLVLDKGAVRFDYPQAWHVEPGPASLRLYDAPPPKDECKLEVSFSRLPPVDWEGFPLADALRQSMEGGAQQSVERGPVQVLRQHGYRLAWIEERFLDGAEKRPARSRVALGLATTVQVVISFVFWEDDVERVTPAWDAMLQSLRLGQVIRDPRDGGAIEARLQ